MNFFCTRLFVLSAMLLPVLAAASRMRGRWGARMLLFPMRSKGRTVEFNCSELVACLISPALRRCAWARY